MGAKTKHDTGYQVSIDYHKSHNCWSSGEAFNPKQLDQLYKLFSSFQNSSNSLTNISLALLAYKGNYLSFLFTTSQDKHPWIIDSVALDYMANTYHLFISYLPCAANLK